MLFNRNKNFCDINSFCYFISVQKGIIKRNCSDLFSKNKFAKNKKEEKLPNVTFEYSSNIIKKGIDPKSQENKATNIKLASSKIDKIIIHPGEIFSFWKTVGHVNKMKGYKEGRIIKQNKLVLGTGGGLCNLANTINNLILHSPLEIIEFNKHSDALACDIGHRVPMANGTCVSYNYIDYRFKNNTEQDVQILLRCDDTTSYGELRSENPFPFEYDIIEENHHFKKEKEEYYRISKIYRTTKERKTNKIINKELIWDNHSLVMFDYSLLPEELITNN